MKHLTRPDWRKLLAAPALLALMSLPAARAPAQVISGPGTVVITGNHDNIDERVIEAATNRLLSGAYASSCAFMNPYNPAFDPVTVAYMREFSHPGSISWDVRSVTEYAPNGDVSNMPLSSSLRGLIPSARRATGGGFGSGGRGGCGPSDWRMAASQVHIARKDKSLREAFDAFNKQDYTRALSLFDTAWSKLGYPAAGLMLGQMHLYGVGMPKDGKQAVYWFDRVAGQRFDPGVDRLRFDPANPQVMNDRIQAAFMLARMYEHGVGVPVDKARARHWYEKAAGFGYVPALDILGTDRLEGSLGPKDTGKGLAWLKEAALAGYVPSQFHVGRLYYTGDAGIARDEKLAGAYFDLAARAGYPQALFAVGRMHDLGLGVPADQNKAIVYYKEAALKGDRDAEFALGTFFYEGGLLDKDAKTARGWFDAAAKQGQPDAMYNLGAMLSRGEGGPQDLAMAYVWLSLAGTAGHDHAAAALREVGPQLTAQDRARADSVLKPGPKS